MKKSEKVVFVIVIIVWALYFSTNLTRFVFGLFEESWFEQYREDFDLINEYVINNFECPPNEKHEIVLFVFDQDMQVVSLYCNSDDYPLSDELKTAFSRMVASVEGRNLDTIRISSTRIDYFGLGNRAFVYSRDGKRPKYLYSEDEHLLSFGIDNLGKGWYYLFYYQR